MPHLNDRVLELADALPYGSFSSLFPRHYHAVHETVARKEDEHTVRDDPTAVPERNLGLESSPWIRTRQSWMGRHADWLMLGEVSEEEV